MDGRTKRGVVACTRLILHYGGAWWVTCDAWYHCCTKCFKTARDMVRPSMPHYDCTCCVTIVHVVSRPWRVTAARDVSWLHVVCHGRAWRVTAVRNVLQPRMTCHGRACVTATRDTSQPRMTRHDCALRSPCLTRNNCEWPVTTVCDMPHVMHVMRYGCALCISHYGRVWCITAVSSFCTLRIMIYGRARPMTAMQCSFISALAT